MGIRLLSGNSPEMLSQVTVSDPWTRMMTRSWPSFPGTLSYLLIAVVGEELLSAYEVWRHGGLFLAHTLAL